MYVVETIPIPLAPPDEKWLGILTTQGLAVMLILFAMFVVFPICVYGLYRLTKWIGEKIDILFSAYQGMLAANSVTQEKIVETQGQIVQGQKTIIDTLQQSVETQDDVKQALMGSISVDDARHVDNLGRLDKIHTGIEGLHEKIDELPERLRGDQKKPPA